MQVIAVYKKSRISVWYLTAVFVMAISYFFLARKDFGWMIGTGVQSLMIGIVLFALLALPVGLVVATVHFMRKRRENR